jgi:hypothetical protein
MDIIKLLENEILPGTKIPKPYAKTIYLVKGWGYRRGERALIYKIPNTSGGKPYEKGINISEWRKAFILIKSGEAFTKKWFVANLPRCNNEGGCNFTTMGGIFQLLGFVAYEQPGVYKSI